MKVKDHKDYNPEFPENFPWGWLDSQRLSCIASVYVNYIQNNLKSDRNLVPGLRLALQVIAEEANLY